MFAMKNKNLSCLWENPILTLIASLESPQLKYRKSRCGLFLILCVFFSLLFFVHSYNNWWWQNCIIITKRGKKRQTKGIESKMHTKNPWHHKLNLAITFMDFFFRSIWNGLSNVVELLNRFEHTPNIANCHHQSSQFKGIHFKMCENIT